MARHKRRSELRAKECQLLLEEVQRTHDQTIDLLRQLKPLDRHYQDLLALDNAIATAVREITGDEALWCR